MYVCWLWGQSGIKGQLTTPEPSVDPENLNPKHIASRMKAFAVLATVLAAASAAPQLLARAPLVAARAAGQVSHQSVTQGSGEVRRLVQSKAFGSAIGSSSQV